VFCVGQQGGGGCVVGFGRQLRARCKGFFVKHVQRQQGLQALHVLRFQQAGKHPARVRGQKFPVVSGGLLVQTPDNSTETRADCEVVTDRAPTEEEWKALEFAWVIVKHVKSNAIVLTNKDTTLGVGAGQMNRVGSADIAIAEAGEKAKGSVMSSDAFFPFGDTIEAAGKAGITAVIQPGGSIRDQESIDMANKYGIAMVFTGHRHFRHS